MKRTKSTPVHPGEFDGSVDDQLKFLVNLNRSKPPIVIEKSLGFLIASTMTRLRILVLRKIKEYGYDITPEQGHVLNAIGESEGISQSEIAGRTMKDKPTITRILDNLEKKKLIERRSDTGDRRAYRIYLTAKGKEKIAMFMKIIEEVDEKAFRGLNDNDIRKLEEILGTVRTNVDRQNE
ncbi:MAG TPA: MarR family transcriptional regulator [Spirochaetota bacterium]|nr:MarR family transcriptional regulator [Spirochaetota bacterium]HPC40454.1 MarR family transcriptional regulator [Spirochaetota bacterium]HPL15807.1 MarR family transcriptional regulator [Spirochaetota bacterium]HQF06521.1 MarR family transcriptional regulator [Spirochaetota bacterium]HQH98106.1 MarR family transcriptional regulator [Spirochaetota bacterium]